jgi:CubicO group peptidase (beta-lactamase class C family)
MRHYPVMRPAARLGAIFLACTFPLVVYCPAQDQGLLEDRVEHVENGLLPAAFVKGARPTPMKLTDRMFVYQVPGVSIAVIHNGKIDWARGFGATKLGGAPTTTETLFQAGSVSKPVTAFAALRLVQAGQLDLDGDINRYLKYWKLPANRFHRAVTPRELLTHTAGTNVPGFPGYASGESVPTLQQILDAIPPANTPPVRVDIEPDTQWRYSGGGYAIMQQVLIDVSGKEFPELMNEEVLVPIGMTRSTFREPLPANLMADTATPYADTGEQVPGGPHTYPEMAAAGLWTDPTDLARFAIAVQHALTGFPHSLLSSGLARDMIATRFGKRGTMFGVGGSDTDPYFAHSGEDAGFVTYLVAYENSGDGAVVMTNGDRGFDLVDEIMRAVANEYGWPDFRPVEHTLASVDARRLARYVGYYRLSDGSLITVLAKKDHLTVQLADQRAWDVFPDGQSHFFSEQIDVQLTFSAPVQGHSPGLVLRQYGSDSTANRIRPDP